MADKRDIGSVREGSAQHENILDGLCDLWHLLLSENLKVVAQEMGLTGYGGFKVTIERMERKNG